MQLIRSHIRTPIRTGTFAAILALSLGGCEMLSTSSTYEDVRAAYEAGQYGIANAHLADVLANGDVDAPVRKLQVELMLKLGDGNRAIAAIEQLSESELGGVERRVALAHAQILQGAPDKTAAIYEPIPIEDYTEQDVRMLLWALRDLGRDDEFTDGMDFALSQFPDSAYLNALAADQLYDLRLPAEAKPYVETAVASGPDILEVQLVAGREAIFDGDLEQAIVLYTRANEINASNPLPLTNVVGLHLDLEQTEEAGKVLKPALERHGGFPFLQWQLARYNLAVGDLQGAREAKDRVVRQFADNPEFVLLMADIEAAFGNERLALDNYRRFVREVGEVPEVMQKIAELEG